jgi:class I fructose-bisphosphate aldolase
MTQYATRIGLELGADMVKIKYGETLEGFKKAVEIAKPIKVGVSGGELISDDLFLDHVKSIMSAGGSGLLIGRNVWQRGCAGIEFAKKIHDIIFGQE